MKAAAFVLTAVMTLVAAAPARAQIGGILNKANKAADAKQKLDDPEHAEHAVQAAIEMVHELGKLNKAWAAKGMAQLDIGVGVNSGDMIAGNIGSSSIMSYTVIGDNVNLGSRLESLNKDYKTRIIMSDATKSRLTRTYETRPLGDVKVKGKTKAVAIHEIVVPAPFATTEEKTL